MSQSKRESLVEAVVNTVIGLCIAFVAQWVIVIAYDIHVSATENFVMVFWMTFVSIARQYVIRRFFNKRTK